MGTDRDGSLGGAALNHEDAVNVVFFRTVHKYMCEFGV